MKKVFLAITILITLVACKKETTTSPSGNNSPSGNTPSGIKDGAGVTDIDGNKYKTIIIGTQEWMAENLKVSKFNDGTIIPLSKFKEGFSSINIADTALLKSAAWSYYQDDTTNNVVYGKLYNWYALNSGKLCPKGWHVPSDTEWETLKNYLGGDLLAGGKMKSTGTANWTGLNASATNESGFSGLPGGVSRKTLGFTASIQMGEFGLFWTSSSYGTNGSENAWTRYLSYASGSLLRSMRPKEDCLSVRFIKD